MRAYLSFDLEKPEDRESFQDAQKGSQYKWCLDEIFNKLRSMSKYEDKDQIAIEEMREIISEIMKENEV